MRSAHPCNRQTWRFVAPAFLLASCASDDRPASIWPPPDFELQVEEVRFEEGAAHTERRFLVGADGVVVYESAISEVVDPESGTSLPVFGSLSVYELVPLCLRALARRVYRAGVLDLDEVQSMSGDADAVGCVVRWRAFGNEKRLVAQGRVHGGMAEILAIVGAHLPEGEQFSLPGVAERGLAPVLRGVPPLRSDPAGALEAILDRLGKGHESRELVLDAFALACHLGERRRALELLAKWRESAPRPRPENGLDAAILERMLPGGATAGR